MTDFSSLDYDCLLMIFSYLSHVDLENTCLVCHDWYEIARTNLLWKELTSKFYVPSDFGILHYDDQIIYFDPFKDHKLQSDYRRLYKLKVVQDAYWLKGNYATNPEPIQHGHSVRGVAFSPVVSNILASCGYDSAAHVYNINSLPAPIHSYKPQNSFNNSWERLSRIKWTCDGENLVVTSSSVGETSVRPLRCLKQVSSIRLDRTGTALATHPRFPYLVAVAGDDRVDREGGDISLIDIRVPGGPIRLLRGIHKHTVRDIEWFLDDQILTASPDGTSKISTLDGKTHTTIQIQTKIEAAAYDGALSATSVQVGEGKEEERQRHITIGCSGVVEVWDIKHSSHLPVLVESFDVFDDHELPVWRLKYNKRGSILFLASDEGFVRMYSRKKVNGEYKHTFEANILSHESDVSDLDISLNEDYVASASQSREVGLVGLFPIEV